MMENTCSETCHLRPLKVDLTFDTRRGFFSSFSLSTKEPIQSYIVFRRWHWRRHQCTPPLGTGLNIETSQLAYICTNIPHTCTSNIYRFQENKIS